MKKHTTISLRVFFVVLLGHFLLPISVDAQSELFGWGQYRLGQAGFDSWTARETFLRNDWNIMIAEIEFVLIKTHGDCQAKWIQM
jgi:hypothetical protein